MMKKNADNTPKFNRGDHVVVAGTAGEVLKTEDDGRVVVRFSNGQTQPIEPDKVTAA